MIIRMPSVSAVLAKSVFLFVLSHYIHQVQQGKICLILCCLQLVDNPGILNPFFHGFLVYLFLLCSEQCFLNQASLQFIPASSTPAAKQSTHTKSMLITRVKILHRF